MNFQPIFDKQSELMNTYAGIEIQVMGVKNHPTRVCNGPETQSVHVHEHIKSILWRTVEELYEANVEFDDFPYGVVSPSLKEELIDALHFLTEACVYVGIKWEDVYQGDVDFDIEDQIGCVSTEDWFELYHSVVSNMAAASYQLKSKPWKQTPKPTDFDMFRKELAKAHWSLIVMLRHFMTTQEILDVYLGKAAVNKERQETKY